MTTAVQTLSRLDPHIVYGVDALVSTAMGLALLAWAGPLTQLAGWAMPPDLLWIIGLLLLPWAAFNAWIARSARPPRVAVTANIVGDVAWIAGTVALLAIHAASLSGPGLALLAGQGIAVVGVLTLKLAGRATLTE